MPCHGALGHLCQLIHIEIWSQSGEKELGWMRIFYLPPCLNQKQYSNSTSSGSSFWLGCCEKNSYHLVTSLKHCSPPSPTSNLKHHHRKQQQANTTWPHDPQKKHHNFSNNKLSPETQIIRKKQKNLIVQSYKGVGFTFSLFSWGCGILLPNL